jgi:hypothetical protein
LHKIINKHNMNSSKETLEEEAKGGGGMLSGERSGGVSSPFK